MRPIDHLRGVLVLATGLTMLILGTPGLDMLSATRWLPDTPQRERQLKQPYGRFLIWATDLNRTFRMPAVRVLTPLQRPIRLAQSWSLYGSGPGQVRRLEIRVDDALVYRSNDPEHRWLRAELRYRKIRPVADSYCWGTSRNATGLVDWIVKRARADYPEATAVVVSCTATEWPGGGPTEIKNARTIRAPDWVQR